MAGLRFRGTIDVQVRADRLEASLVLQKAGDLEYDEGALVRVLADAGVTEGFEPDALVEVVTNFQKSKDPQLTVVVARGQAPVPATTEAWQWVELLPLPADLQAVAQRVFKQAGPPEVVHHRIEKVRVQKKVPGKDPQIVVEAREVREKVLVDPTVVRVHWVEASTSVATVQPPRPGQNGRDLGGQALVAPPAKGPGFLAGAGLEKRQNEIWATVTGFLRVGRNWADLVPHRASFWEVTYSDDRTSAFLTYEPGDAQAEVPTAEAVLARLQADGLPEDRWPSPEQVDRWLSEAVASGRGFRTRSLGPDRDGRFEVRFNADRTKAFLDLDKPLGTGAPLSLKDLGAALREAQLKDFSFDTVKGVVQDFLSGPETTLRDFVLASGTPPTRGADQVLTFTVALLTPDQLERTRQALLGDPAELAAVPQRDRLSPEQVRTAGPVRAQQPFARIEAPEGGGGIPGVDVSGKPLDAVPGNEPALELLAHVRKNGDRLVSDIDGLMESAVINGVTVVRVRPHLDAVVAVARSADNLEAALTLVQGRGTGTRLDRGLVDRALAAAQVNAGLDEDALGRALAAAEAGEKVEGWVVARGTPAANDLTRRLTFLAHTRTGADGRLRATVKADEVVATYLPPVEGRFDGCDVLGNVIPSPDNEVRNLVVGEDFTVETNPETGLQSLRAQVGGELVFDGEALSLVTRVSVQQVGAGAANVKFPGEVQVLGGVATGAWVMAGDLKVRGRVGGALLSSDRNIQVVDGIHGEGRAVLRAKSHISVGFVERSLLMAVGDVHVGKTALGCTFRVNGKIYQKAPGGGVQGGLTKVRLGMDVRNLGSPSGQPTAVSFGQDYLVEDQIAAETKETDKLREAIVQLDVLMRKLSASGDRDKLDQAWRKKVVLMKMLDKRNLKLIHLRDKFELHVASEIVVRETLFPGVSIESHGRVYEPQNRRTAIRLVFNEQTGHIEEFPL